MGFQAAARRPRAWPHLPPRAQRLCRVVDALLDLSSARAGSWKNGSAGHPSPFQALIREHGSASLLSNPETQVQRGEVRIPMPGQRPALPRGVARGPEEAREKGQPLGRLRKPLVSGLGRSRSRGADAASGRSSECRRRPAGGWGRALHQWTEWWTSGFSAYWA